MDMGQRFRELISRPEGVFGFGVACALDAWLAVEQGAECIYAGGYSIAMNKRLPDMGLMTMTEVRAEVEAITRAADAPVIADIDDGYGSALNVLRTVESFLGRYVINFSSWQAKRVAGLHLEDQKYPKRCGHVAGKEVVVLAEMTGKIKAACDVRDILYKNAVIIARTDALDSATYHLLPEAERLKEAINRSVVYIEAGADLVWCEFNKPDRGLAEEFAAGVKKFHPSIPLAFNYSPSLDWHKEENPLTFEELNALGYKFIFITIAAAHAASYGVANYMSRIKAQGAAALWEIQRLKIGHPTEKHHLMGGVPAWQELEKRYVPGAGQKQKGSEGFRSDK